MYRRIANFTLIQVDYSVVTVKGTTLDDHMIIIAVEISICQTAGAIAACL